jgi:hypothetical protein
VLEIGPGDEVATILAAGLAVQLVAGEGQVGDLLVVQDGIPQFDSVQLADEGLALLNPPAWTSFSWPRMTVLLGWIDELLANPIPCL